MQAREYDNRLRLRRGSADRKQDRRTAYENHKDTLANARLLPHLPPHRCGCAPKGKLRGYLGALSSLKLIVGLQSSIGEHIHLRRAHRLYVTNGRKSCSRWPVRRMPQHRPNSGYPRNREPPFGAREGDYREVRRRHVISIFHAVGRCLRPCASTTPGAARSIATHARYCAILCELVAPRGWYRSSAPRAVDASAPAAAPGRTCGNIRRAR